MPPLQPESHAHTAAATGRGEHVASAHPVTPTVTEVVEARTAEDAVAEVHRRFGPGARIVHAEKVLRGGIGGFFARELVQLTVELPSTEPPTGDVRVIPGRAARAHADGPSRTDATPVRDADEAADRTGPVSSTGRGTSRVAGGRHEGSTNPLRAALAAGVDDGPPGETFGELLDRRAAAQRTVDTAPAVSRPTAGGGSGEDGTGWSPGGAGARPDVIERLTWETDARERTFGEVLRSTMLADLPGAGTVSAPSPRDDAAPSAPRDEATTSVAVAAPAVVSTAGPPPSATRPAGGEDGVTERPGPGATITGDDGTLLRGAASLIRDTPLRGGAAQLVARAEHVDVTDRAPAPDPGAARPDPGTARLESARRAAVARIDAAIAASTERTTPARDATGDPGPTTARTPAPTAGTATASVDTVTEPLAVRHEAFRQLRASGGLGAEQDPPAARAVARPTTSTDAPPTPTTPRRRTVDGRRGQSAWSADALARAGAPAEVVEGTCALHPSDDVQWFAAVARALEPFCGPLPSGPEVVVGPRARRLAPHLAAEVVGADGHPAPGRSVVLPQRRTPDTRRWLTEERGDRGLHMVVGGAGWRDWLFELPDVVSWTRDEDLTDALDTATRFGLVLGWQLGRDVARRATPIDLAVALRARVVGR